MDFEFHNNPTEMAFMVAIMVVVKGVVSGEVMDWITWFVVVCMICIGFMMSFHEMVTNLVGDWLSATAKLEIISIFIFVICTLFGGLIGSYEAYDSQGIWWFIILAAGQYHAINLNLIFHEIICEDCGLYNLAVVVVPNMIWVVLDQSMQLAALKACAISIWLLCIWLWTVYSRRICDALRMDYWWSIPNRNNNPQRKQVWKEEMKE